MDVDDSYFDDLDRKFFNLSSTMNDWFSWSYGVLGWRLVEPLDPTKFDNATSKVNEIGIRAMIVLGALACFCFAGTFIFGVGIVLAAGGKIFKEAALYFQKDGFTHVRCSAAEKNLDQKSTVMIWNIRGHAWWDSLQYGVISWRSRIEGIVANLRSANPDILVLQDVFDTALKEVLLERLGDLYAHAYIHIGESGTIIFSKGATHQFTHTDFAAQSSSMKRGFEMFEIKASPEDKVPFVRIIGTRLSPDKGADDIREAQFEQIVRTLKKQEVAVPTLFLGEGEGEFLSKYLYHSYRDKEPTQTDQLVTQWAPIYAGQEQVRHFISFFKRNPADGSTLPVVEKNVRLVETTLVKGFDETYNTKTALSDCNGIVTTWMREAQKVR